MTSRVVRLETEWTEHRMLTGDITRRPGQLTGPAKPLRTRNAILPTAGMHGFTYIAILIAIAIIGTALASVGVVWHTAQQREHERELLFVGAQFRQAIGRYYNASAGMKQYPQSLQDLLRDPRQPGVARYLRKIYYDPITGTSEWGLIKTSGDRIMGVYSLSEAMPLKQANFDWSDREFEGKEKYSQWTFVYQPNQAHPPANIQAPAAPNPEPQSKQWSSTNY